MKYFQRVTLRQQRLVKSKADHLNSAISLAQVDS